jgi:hypothetical protein
MSITYCPSINKPKDRIKINKYRSMKQDKVSNLDGWSCELCKLQKKCKQLCPPMQWVISRVEVEPGTEIIPSNPDYERESNKWPESHSTTEIIFLLFFFDHKTPLQISNQLNKSLTYIYRSINKAKQIIIENLKKKVENGS